MKNILFVVLVFLKTNSYCEPLIFATGIVKSVDSVILETKFGNLTITSECDSSASMGFISGQLFKGALSKSVQEAEALHILSDKCYISFTITKGGKLAGCDITRPAKLYEFRIVLQEFVNEINAKYKDKVILCASGEETTYQIPIHFEYE